MIIDCNCNSNLLACNRSILSKNAQRDQWLPHNVKHLFCATAHQNHWFWQIQPPLLLLVHSLYTVKYNCLFYCTIFVSTECLGIVSKWENIVMVLFCYAVFLPYIHAYMPHQQILQSSYIWKEPQVPRNMTTLLAAWQNMKKKVYFAATYI